jgi:ribosome production factor 1
MGKKGPVSKSLQGKKPINSAKKVVETKHKRQKIGGTSSNHNNQNDSSTSTIYVPNNPGQIGNKLKRSEMYGKYLQQKALLKQERRRQQKKEQDDDEEEQNRTNGGNDAYIPKPKNVPKTLESTRELEITMIDPNNMVEILGDEADDEFAPYFYNYNHNVNVKKKSGSSFHKDSSTTLTTAELDDEKEEGENQKYESDEEGDEEKEDDTDNDDDDDDDDMDESSQHRPIPKILITTRPHPSQKVFYFIADLQNLIPHVHYYPRKLYSVSQITQYAYNRNFTHLIILSEKNKICNGMLISHLGYRAPPITTSSVDDDTKHNIDDMNEEESDENASSSSSSSSSSPFEPLVGPTAFFKVSNVVTGSNIPHHGCRTSHRSEMNLYNFQFTRLGRRIGRLFASLFPIQQGPEFMGRQIVTFHNQRDYIFVRHHRYVFRPTNNTTSKESTTTTTKSKSSKKDIPLDTTTAPTQVSDAAAKIPVQTKLQELGPRFTLKLRWLQDGVIAENGTGTNRYEFLHKRKEMDTSRRKFHL